MCEKKEGPTDLTPWVQMMCGQTGLPLDQFMRHLESVMMCLPQGTWSLVIHVDGPGRFGLPSILRPNGGSPPSGSTSPAVSSTIKVGSLRPLSSVAKKGK